MNRLYESDSFDPTLNLAIEEALLLYHAQEPSLFLWQNAHTVVIGRGQNAWKECRVNMLDEDKGVLVRRTTGGGAVYHDLGNLNFSFVMPKDIYDVTRQLNVIKKAVAEFGIEAEFSGRNDLIIKDSGAKFSGNAFRKTKESALHHGTILFDVDMQNLGKYLAPSTAKLKAKGVDSVRSRVENLRARAPDMDISLLKQFLFAAFANEYGAGKQTNWKDIIKEEDLQFLREKYRSWDWTFGRTPDFDVSFNNRFSWGEVEILFSLRRGQVDSLSCYTDANDPDMSQRIKSALEGVVFTHEALSAALKLSGLPEDNEIAQWLSLQEF